MPHCGWAGDLVVVEESATTDTPHLAAIRRHMDNVGAKLLIVTTTRSPPSARYRVGHTAATALIERAT
jgi:hypothetical protein